MKSKKILTTIAAFIFIIGVFAAMPPAYAQEPNTQHANFFQGLIDKIAQKFGLEKSQVQSVVNDYKQQKMQDIKQNMQDREKNRLDQLVKDGKITSAQETAIIAELEALRTKYNPANAKNLTADQRKQQFQDEQNELKSWAQSQGIDMQYIMPQFGMRKGPMRDRMGWGHKGPNQSPTPTPTS